MKIPYNCCKYNDEMYSLISFPVICLYYQRMPVWCHPSHLSYLLSSVFNNGLVRYKFLSMKPYFVETKVPSILWYDSQLLDWFTTTEQKSPTLYGVGVISGLRDIIHLLVTCKDGDARLILNINIGTPKSLHTCRDDMLF